MAKVESNFNLFKVHHSQFLGKHLNASYCFIIYKCDLYNHEKRNRPKFLNEKSFATQTRVEANKYVIISNCKVASTMPILSKCYFNKLFVCKFPR
jgi:hypothetical protein